MRRATRFAVALPLIALAACESAESDNPFEPDDPGRVIGQTATWNGITAFFITSEDDFLPDNRFGQPEPGFRYFVVLVEVSSGRDSPYFNTVFDFELGFPDNTRWDPALSWKEPALAGGTLNRGDAIRGWITFEIPIGARPNRLFWSPIFNVTLAIPIT